MRFAYQFSNLLGTVYRKGNILYTSDGNTLLSPVGNRITVFELNKHISRTLSFENMYNIKVLVLSPKDDILLSVDEQGRAILVNFRREALLSRFTFKQPVSIIQFDPSGKMFAAGVGRNVQIWKAPPKYMEFTPFRLLRTITGHYDEITTIDWSSDSRFLITGSRDSTCRITAVTHRFKPAVLVAHKAPIMLCRFSKTRNLVYSVCSGGSCYVWKWKANENKGKAKTAEEMEEMEYSSFEGAWRIKERFYLNLSKADVTSCVLQKEKELLVIGMSNGVFALYMMPHFSEIHSLSISQNPIDTMAINPTGEWIAFGSEKQGQLLVWEWQSETYLLKQQGHYYDMNTTAFSPNGQLIATGSDDGKVKIWNSRTGFCFVTFTEHEAPVSAVTFSSKGTGHALFSAALDGTIRAFDLIRYKNFRTFTSPSATQFSCLAVDPSGDIVVAGSMDGFEVYVWSIQTSKLLDVLKGHEGPVSSLAFNPTKPVLASSSWDATVRIWDIYSDGVTRETLQHESEVLAIAYSPSGNFLATATMDGNINIWDVENALQIGMIEGRKDIAGGRLFGSARTAKSTEANKHFTTICYTADGECILAGGKSKYICIYHVKQQVLVRKFQISRNLSLDGMIDFLSARHLTDGGPVNLIDDNEEKKDYMPGAKRGDLSKRITPPEIRTKAVQFSPTGRSFVAATTEGMMLYSLDEKLTFDPFELDIEVTPENTLSTLHTGQYLKALIMSFQLNEEELIKKVFYGIPPSQIQLTAKDIPANYLARVLSFLSRSMYGSPHLQYHLLWSSHLLSFHSHTIESDVNVFITALRDLQKNISGEYQDLSKLCADNRYTLEFYESMAKHKQKEVAAEEGDEDLADLLAMDRSNPFASDSNKNPFASDSNKNPFASDSKKRPFAALF